MFLIRLNRIIFALTLITVGFILFGNDQRMDIFEFAVLMIVSLSCLSGLRSEFQLRRFFRELDG